MNIADQITKTLFHLLNSNKGDFTSKTQAGFILSHSESNTHTAIKKYRFGEFGGTIHLIEYHFHLDQQGVKTVYKYSKSTGKSSVYFDRDDQEIVATFKAKFERRSKRLAIADKLDQVDARIKELGKTRFAINELMFDRINIVFDNDWKNDPQLTRLRQTRRSIENRRKVLDQKYRELLKEFDNL